jgi:hypothetical protein
MTVTSEEKVLDAILTWCMEASETSYWNSVDKLLSSSMPEQLFGGRLTAINDLLPFPANAAVSPSAGTAFCYIVLSWNSFYL